MNLKGRINSERSVLHYSRLRTGERESERLVLDEIARRGTQSRLLFHLELPLNPSNIDRPKSKDPGATRRARSKAGLLYLVHPTADSGRQQD
jgi:hypothetical protein